MIAKPDHQRGAWGNKQSTLCAILLLTLTGIVVGMAGCQSPPTKSVTPEKPKEIAQLPPPHFVGSEDCRGCHPKIAQDHEVTGHARTMRLADKAHLLEQYPKAGKTGSFEYVVNEEQGILQLALQSSPLSKIPLAYAFGAGKNALTFLCPYEDDKLVELRMSYHPKLKEWFITPGQVEKMKGAELGLVWESAMSKRCVHCHTTTQDPKELIPEDKFFGVGCETCHGAGSNHVEVMRQTNKSPYYIDKKAHLGGKEMNDMCGDCHRRTQDVMETDKGMTQRFQPYGLALSKCFKNSNNELTCVTCHNPHQNASTNHPQYNKVCLSCHTTNVTPPAKLSKVVVCPKQPQGNCVNCHMPLKALRKKYGNILIQMADHYIR